MIGDRYQIESGRAYIVSPALYREIAARCSVKDLAGIRLAISHALPYESPRKDLPPVSLSRFAEFEAADMDWAEPLGLARWQSEAVHCLCVN